MSEFLETDASGQPRILRWLDAVTVAANVAGSLLIFGLVILIGTDVSGRNLFGAPVSGVPEIVSLSIVAIVFMQAPMALKAGRMTRSDGVLNMLKRHVPGFAKALETIFDLFGIGVLTAILLAHWPILVRSWERNDFVGAVGDFTAPTWPVKLVLLIGACLLLLQFAGRILRRQLGIAQ